MPSDLDHRNTDCLTRTSQALMEDCRLLRQQADKLQKKARRLIAEAAVEREARTSSRISREIWWTLEM